METNRKIDGSQGDFIYVRVKHKKTTYDQKSESIHSRQKSIKRV